MKQLNQRYIIICEGWTNESMTLMIIAESSLSTFIKMNNLSPFDFVKMKNTYNRMKYNQQY